MSNQNNPKQVLTFAASNAYVFFINNLGKIGILNAVLLMSILHAGNMEYRRSAMILGVAIVSLGPWLVATFLRKFAYKVVIDFGARVLKLYMLRTNNVIEAPFGEITSIRVRGYIIFNVRGKRIFCNSADDKELLDCLARIMPIT